jgi:hypothetical protein
MNFAFVSTLISSARFALHLPVLETRSSVIPTARPCSSCDDGRNRGAMVTGCLDNRYRVACMALLGLLTSGVCY